MEKSKSARFILAVATLAGTIIGVGFLSLPYITSKVGAYLMMIYFAVLSVLMVIVHCFFGDVALATPDFKRLPGYAEIYLGKSGKTISLISSILGSFGSILAYIVVGGVFLANFVIPYFGGSAFLWTLIYFFIGAIFIFLGIKAISKLELWSLILIFVITIFVFLNKLSFFNISNLLEKPGSFTDFFLPYGPILFALGGISLIPEMEEILAPDKKLLKKAIALGVIIPAVFYIFFIFMVLGFSGVDTSEEAISGLRFLGNKVVNILFFFGILATLTSFVTIGLTLNKVFHYDLKINRLFSWLATCFVPLLLFLAGVQNFIKIIGFVGGVFMAIDGIMIMLMHKIVKKNKHVFFSNFIIFVFIAGAIYQIIYFFKN